MALPTSGTIDPADWEAEFDAIVSDINDTDFAASVTSDLSVSHFERKWILPVVAIDLATATSHEFVFTAPDNLILSAVWAYASGGIYDFTTKLEGADISEVIRQGDGYTLSASTTAGGYEEGDEDEVYQSVGGIPSSDRVNADAIMLRKGVRYKVTLTNDSAGTLTRCSMYLMFHAQRRID